MDSYCELPLHLVAHDTAIGRRIQGSGRGDTTNATVYRCSAMYVAAACCLSMRPRALEKRSSSSRAAAEEETTLSMAGTLTTLLDPGDVVGVQKERPEMVPPHRPQDLLTFLVFDEDSAVACTPNRSTSV